MINKELEELCKTWTMYIQLNGGSLHEGYWLDGDKVVYLTDDGEVLESSEHKLIEDINVSFEKFLRRQSADRLKCEYCEVALEVKYEEHPLIYNEVCELLSHMDYDKRNDYIVWKIMQRIDDPFKRASYLLQSIINKASP